MVLVEALVMVVQTRWGSWCRFVKQVVSVARVKVWVAGVLMLVALVDGVIV